MNMKSAMRMAALVSVLALFATSESEALAVPSRHLDKRGLEKLATLMGTMLKPVAGGAATTTDDAAKAAALASQGVDDTVKIATEGATAATDDGTKAASQGAAGAADETFSTILQGKTIEETIENIQKQGLTVLKIKKNAAGEVEKVIFKEPNTSKQLAVVFAGSSAIAGATVLGSAAIINSLDSEAEGEAQAGEGAQEFDVGSAPATGPVGPTGQIDAKVIQKDEETGLYYVRDRANDLYYIYDPVSKSWSTYCREGAEYAPCPADATASSTATPTQALGRTGTTTSMASLTLETPAALFDSLLNLNDSQLKNPTCHDKAGRPPTGKRGTLARRPSPLTPQRP